MAGISSQPQHAFPLNPDAVSSSPLAHTSCILTNWLELAFHWNWNQFDILELPFPFQSFAVKFSWKILKECHYLLQADGCRFHPYYCGKKVPCKHQKHYGNSADWRALSWAKMGLVCSFFGSYLEDSSPDKFL